MDFSNNEFLRRLMDEGYLLGCKYSVEDITEYLYENNISVIEWVNDNKANLEVIL